MTMAVVKTRESLRWEAVDAGGWQYLLPPISDSRILCYDTGGSTLLLGGLCRELVVLHPDAKRRAEIVKQGLELGLPKIAAYALDEFHPDADWVKDGFDGFVLHDPDANFLVRDNQQLHRLLESLRSVLRRDSFAYFGVRHRYGVDRLLAWRRREKTERQHPFMSATVLRRLMGSSGLGFVHRVPVMMHQARVTEVLAQDGYSSVKNSFLFAERIKEIVLGKYGSRWFAPFYCLVANKAENPPSFIEQLRQYLMDEVNTDQVHRRQTLLLRRWVALNGGKVILSFGPPQGINGGLIVVLAHDEITARRREIEGIELKAMAALPSELAALIPKQIHQCTFHGIHCFVLSEFPGITIDVPMPHIWEITRNALGFLVALHRTTHNVVRVNRDTYPALIGDLFNAARHRYPVFNDELVLLEGHLKKEVWDLELPSVRLHGDYKIENVMVNPDTFEITGVIDWELSRPSGLPLLDVIYLLVYNRVIYGQDWFSAYQAIMLHSRRTVEEEKVWNAYLRDFPVAPDLIPVLSVLFVLHHIGYRQHIDLAEPGREAEMRVIIQSLMNYAKINRPAGQVREEGRGT